MPILNPIRITSCSFWIEDPRDENILIHGSRNWRDNNLETNFSGISRKDKAVFWKGSQMMHWAARRRYANLIAEAVNDSEARGVYFA